MSRNVSSAWNDLHPVGLENSEVYLGTMRHSEGGAGLEGEGQCQDGRGRP